MCEHNVKVCSGTGYIKVRGSRVSGVHPYPDSLLLGGSGRVVGTQALGVIAVTALIAL